VHDHDSRDQLAGELHRGVQIEAVVERADERDDPRTEQHAVPQLRRLRAVSRRQPDQAREQHSAEDREPSEQWRGTVRETALARLVDRADAPCDAHRHGGQQRGHGRGEEEGVKRVELGWLRHRVTHSIARAGVVSGARPLRGRGRGHAGEALVQRVALDDRGDAFGQLVASRVVLGRERSREDLPDLHEVLLL
jgi:hypothetical protein